MRHTAGEDRPGEFPSCRLFPGLFKRGLLIRGPCWGSPGTSAGPRSYYLGSWRDVTSGLSGQLSGEGQRPGGGPEVLFLDPCPRWLWGEP